MSNEPRVDYARVKTSALRTLAAGGDGVAAHELAKRDVPLQESRDVESMTDAELRTRVRAWRDGTTAHEREHNRDLAVRAQAELEARFRTDEKLWDGQSRRPQPPAVAPWQSPREPRCTGWQRPRGSSLYPADTPQAAGVPRRMRNV